jgi:hypothetical protein
VGVEQVALVDRNRVGFLELLLEEVGDLRRKSAKLVSRQDTSGAMGIGQNHEWGDLVAILIQAFERLHDRRHQIRTTPNRLGKDQVRPILEPQTFGNFQEIFQSATETSPGHFSRRAYRAEQRCVHQILRLIVGNECDSPSLAEVMAS